MTTMDVVQTGALTVAVATAAGAGTTLILRKLFKVPPPQVAQDQSKTESQPTRLGALTGLVARFVPATKAQIGNARNSLMRAGIDIPPSTLWALRITLGAAGLAIGAAAWPVVGGIRGAALAAALAFAGAFAPQLWIMAKRRSWQSELEAQLPDALDLMTIAMSAGSSFDAAIGCVAAEMDGALAKAFRQVGEEARFSSRADALARLADRAQVPSLTIFAASINQTEKSGGSVVDILRSQAETVRKQRRLRVEEKANQLAAKMLIPMLGLIFPCFAIVLLTPMVGLILEALS